ncbi:hypothetical protein HPULCUR_001206 [Helicostylum pulchrum]|uniref:Uncharacterized protein n=1 Tax=Helicostylum pulchrum TaxID=562976 RepID=A0ABP9XM70_9FUNG
MHTISNASLSRRALLNSLSFVDVPVGRREPTSPHRDVYLQRRSLLMIDADEQAASVVKEQQEQQQRREIPVSRYSYRQVSTRAKEASKPTQPEQAQKKYIQRKKTYHSQT